MFPKDGITDKDIGRRMNAGNIINGGLYAVVTKNKLSRDTRLAVHSGVLIPCYYRGIGSEAWNCHKKYEIM